MTVLRWDERDDSDAAKHGVVETWLEIDERGVVRREIDFTEEGRPNCR